MMAAQYPAALPGLDFGPDWLAVPPLGDSVDPFNFQQRIAAYKRIIDDSNAHGIFGTENQYNLFWGYVVQIFWQWRTKRLSSQIHLTAASIPTVCGATAIIVSAPFRSLEP